MLEQTDTLCGVEKCQSHNDCCKNHTIAIKIAMFVGVEKIRLSHVGSNFTRKMLISVTAVVNTNRICWCRYTLFYNGTYNINLAWQYSFRLTFWFITHMVIIHDDRYHVFIHFRKICLPQFDYNLNIQRRKIFTVVCAVSLKYLFYNTQNYSFVVTILFNWQETWWESSKHNKLLLIKKSVLYQFSNRISKYI